MTSKPDPSNWLQRPVSVPLFVLMFCGFAGSGIGQWSGIIPQRPAVDSVARESVDVIYKRMDRQDRKIDSIDLRLQLMYDLLKDMRRDQQRGHQGAEE